MIANIIQEEMDTTPYVIFVKILSLNHSYLMNICYMHVFVIVWQ